MTRSSVWAGMPALHRRWCQLLFVVLMTGASPARAHTGGTLSYAQWTGDEQVFALTLRVKAADFRNLPAERIGNGLDHYLQQNTELFSGEQVCRADRSDFVPGADTWTHLRLSFDCPFSPTAFRMRWLEPMPGHLHLLTHADSISLIRGGAVRTLPLQQQPPGDWRHQLAVQWEHGVRHIAEGWDHLAFLLGLLLLAGSLGALALMITGFTIGHTAALLLATLHGVLPPSATIELAIAASIVFIGLPQQPGQARGIGIVLMLLACVGAAIGVPGDPLIWMGLFLIGVTHQALRTQPRQAAMANLVLASAFGLLHGFGFASAVLEDAQQATQLWPVLLGFNLGVETGQLLFVLPVWALLRWLNRRLARGQATTAYLIQAGVLGVGGFALASRLLAAT